MNLVGFRDFLSYLEVFTSLLKKELPCRIDGTVQSQETVKQQQVRLSLIIVMVAKLRLRDEVC